MEISSPGALLDAAHLGCIEPHPWNARIAGRDERPGLMIQGRDRDLPLPWVRIRSGARGAR